VKTVSDKVVRHSLAYVFYPFENDWLGRPICVKSWRMLTHPLQKNDFQSLRSWRLSRNTCSKKVPLSLIGSPPRAFQLA